MYYNWKKFTVTLNTSYKSFFLFLIAILQPFTITRMTIQMCLLKAMKLS